MSDVSQNDQSGNFHPQKIQSRIIYRFNSAFCFCIFQLQRKNAIFISERQVRVIFVASRELVTFDCVFSGLFQTIRHRASLSWHVFLERRISIAFFGKPCDSMRQKYFWCDFLCFVSICFTVFTIPRCATHGFRSAGVLICRAEASCIYFFN